MSVQPDDLLADLHRRGLITTATPDWKPLAGGVSSDIWLVDDGQRRLVLKRALPKLRVKEDWYADVSRNRHEQEYIAYVSRFLPEAVPRVYHADAELGYFTMEYLGTEYANWKTELLAGQAVAAHAVRAGRILGAIHARSWNDPEARARFATTPQFFQLRIEPYLLTTGRRHPGFQGLFQEVADRLANTALALVHGDYSPKNILIGPERMVLLDCEVAWFGDPAFDVAFLLNHLFLKALYHQPNPAAYLDLAERAWQAYLAELRVEEKSGLEERVCRLLLMLMWARVDGKSPVEYLGAEEKKALVREFASEFLRQAPATLAAVMWAWKERLEADRQGSRTRPGS
jgi:aminoglycoside phosphotransferase (APT) family kinase protein